MQPRKTIYLLPIVIIPLFCLGACSRGPERQLIGQWQMDIEKTRAEIESRMDEQNEEGSAAHAFGRALLGAVSMQQRELTFNRDGTVRAVVRGNPEQIPWPGGGAVLQQEKGEWQAEQVGPNVVKVRIAGGEREFADWRAEIHFESNDRFYYYTGEDLDVREYWARH